MDDFPIKSTAKVVSAILAVAIILSLLLSACTTPPQSESGMSQVFRSEIPMTGTMLFESR